MTESFYEVLGVPEDASTEAITDAYRERVKEVHPDVSDEDDAAEQFKLVSKAEEVLTDETERQRYDRLGHEAYLAREQGTGGTNTKRETQSSGQGFDDIRDAAAWASENTGRSGPTNRGADAGWRQREKRRHNGDDSWDVGGDDGWYVGQEETDRGGSDEGWAFGGQDWDLGDSDWDLGANWQSEDEGDKRDWNTRQRNSGHSSGGDRNSSRTGNERDASWADRNRTRTNTGQRRARTGGVDPTTDPAGAASSGTGQGRRGSPQAEKASTDGGKATGVGDGFRRPEPGVHAAETQWGADDSSYTVSDWTEQSDTKTSWSFWPDLQDDNLGLVVGTFFMIPLMLVTTVFPPFPLPINVVIGICTLLVTGYLITRPSLGVVVFAPWAVLLPSGLLLYGLELQSPMVLSAIVGTWIPLAYALLISFSLDQQ